MMFHVKHGRGAPLIWLEIIATRPHAVFHVKRGSIVSESGWEGQRYRSLSVHGSVKYLADGGPNN